MPESATITVEDLVKRVDEAPENIAMANLLELRSAYGRGRVTEGVLDWIRSKLHDDHRIGVLTPEVSELSQELEVYIYKLDAPVGGLLNASVNPSEGGLRRLREVAKPANRAVEADANLSVVKAALEDATVALQDYLGENRAA